MSKILRPPIYFQPRFRQKPWDCKKSGEIRFFKWVVSVMKALSISRLVGWLNMADSFLLYVHQSGIWLLGGRASDPSWEDDKKNEETGLCAGLSAALPWPTGWLAPQRPGGTLRELASTCDERRWPIVSCYWSTTHDVCVGSEGGGGLKYKGMPLKEGINVLWPCFKAKGDTCHLC